MPRLALGACVARVAALALGCSGIVAGGCSGIVEPGAPSGDAPDPYGPLPDGVDGPVCPDRPGPQPLRRMTKEQYRNSVEDLLGVRPTGDLVDDRYAAGFRANADESIAEVALEKYLLAAELVAEQVVATRETLLGCMSGEAADACTYRFIDDLATRAYRRPLADDEEVRLHELYDWGVTEEGPAVGFQLAIEAILQSPHFLYIDLGSEDALSDYHVATRLSYLFWNTMPDEELRRAADAGELHTQTGIEAQVDRMARGPRFLRRLVSFHRQWLGLEDLESAPKDTDAFPEFSELRHDMAQETEDYIAWWINESDGTLSTLLTSRSTPASDALLDVYGVDDRQRSDDGTVTLDPQERAGLLTQPAFLASHAGARETSIVVRGKFLRTSVLCLTVPEPPAGVDTNPPRDPNLTQREQLQAHRVDPTCEGCHKLIDPFGIPFENYDAIGQYRREEPAGPVDPSVVLESADGLNGTYANAIDLVDAMSRSQLANDCFATQWFRFALGRQETEADACNLKRIRRAMEDNDVRTLLRSIATSDGFRFRNVGEAPP